MFFSKRFRKGHGLLDRRGEICKSHLCRFEPLEDRLLLTIDLSQQALNR